MDIAYNFDFTLKMADSRASKKDSCEEKKQLMNYLRCSVTPVLKQMNAEEIPVSILRCSKCHSLPYDVLNSSTLSLNTAFNTTEIVIGHLCRPKGG
jgi:hypothetical protein